MTIGVMIAIVLSVTATIAPAQKRRSHETSSNLSKRQQELIALQRSIREHQQRVEELAQKERTLLRAVAQMEQLLQRQRRYVRLLEEEIADLDRRQQQLRRTQHGYGTALEYELDRIARLALILAGTDDDSPLDTAIVGAMLRKLEHRARTLKRQHDSTGSALNRLERYRAARSALAVQQQREQQRTERLFTLRTQLLDKLRRDRRAIELQLQQLRKSAAAIEHNIERLARSDRKTSAAPPGGKLSSLLQPAQGAILRGYGEYRHPATGAKAFNAGVDIAVPIGTPVRAAAAGTVVSVQWLPAMNSVVIIDHGNGMRTVYGNLDRVNVHSGNRVNAGQTIGTSGETLSGAFVHFELWQGVKRLDPTFLLR
ncbi:MAG: peptidoglycan DD-metalloendopeptidase family protein [Chlorobi bacterium]|nr:peptidoglycan DD-metalloendopeptidase family protein [Chlorobiota bacterium]